MPHTPHSEGWMPVILAIPALPEPLDSVTAQARLQMTTAAQNHPEMLQGTGITPADIQTHELGKLFAALPEEFLEIALGADEKFNACHQPAIYDLSEHAAQRQRLAESINLAANTLPLEGSFEPVDMRYKRLGLTHTDTLAFERKGAVIEITLSPKPELADAAAILDSARTSTQRAQDLQALESVLERAYAYLGDQQQSPPVHLDTSSTDALTRSLIHWADYAMNSSHEMCQEFSDHMHVPPEFIVQNQELALQITQVFNDHDHFPTQLDTIRKRDAAEAVMVVATAAKAMNMPLQALDHGSMQFMDVDLRHMPDLRAQRQRLATTQPAPLHSNDTAIERN